MIEETLMQNYLYQKEKILKRFGVSKPLNRSHAALAMRPTMRKMAAVVVEWDFSPEIIMEAIFNWAIFNKHVNGPQPNMFASRKYINNALSNYLGIPYELVSQKQSEKYWLEKIDKHYAECVDELNKSGADLRMATSYPLEFRFLMAVSRFDTGVTTELSRDMINYMAEDKKVMRWANHRGITYDAVAKIHNKQNE